MSTSRMVERVTDRELILHPGLWPRWPFLALKRHDPMAPGNLGVMWAGAGSATVYLINMCEIPRNQRLLETKPKRVYESLDALLADGWTVD